MPKNVVWSPLSEKDLELLLGYLHTAWNEQIVHQFLDELDLLY